MKSEVPKQPAFRQADVIASFVLSRLAKLVKSVWFKIRGRKVEKSAKVGVFKSPHRSSIVVYGRNDTHEHDYMLTPDGQKVMLSSKA